MTSKLLAKAAVLASTAVMVATTFPVQAAFAQDDGGYGQPPPRYDQQGGGPYDQPPPDNDQGGGDYDQAPPPPPGYDGSAPPPPPPGYQGYGYDQGQGQYQQGPDPQDQRYAGSAERWAQDNCVKSHGNVAGGAIVGGAIGAIIGAATGGRHSGGAFAGAVIGGTAGAAIAADSGGNVTSPGCPPGYVVRDGAPGFYYGASYAYAAPYWYRPWIWEDERWIFRPYPYHAWYFQHYGHGGRNWRGRDHRWDRR